MESFLKISKTKARLICLLFICTIFSSRSSNAQTQDEIEQLKKDLPKEYHHCIEETKIREDGNCSEIWEPPEVQDDYDENSTMVIGSRMGIVDFFVSFLIPFKKLCRANLEPNPKSNCRRISSWWG